MWKIALQASNGQYVCAEGGGGRELVANRGALGPWETFTVHELGDGKVALQADNGQYVCAEGGGGQIVVANRGAIGAWETFTYHDLGGGKIALQAYNGQYLCAEGGGGQIIVANRNAIGAWETFALTTVSGSSTLMAPLPAKLALQADNGQYVCAEGGGGSYLVANRNALGPWETFTVHSLGGGKVALQASNGQYVCAEGGGGGAVVVNRNAIGAWETFTYHNLGGGKIALQTYNGHYLCAEGGGGQVIVANRGALGPWETFTMTPIAAETATPEVGTGTPTLKVLSGDKQTAARALTSSGIAIAKFAAMSVELKDSNGNPLAGEHVTWSAANHPAGMAVQMEPSGASPCIVVTDANGVATLNKMGGYSIQAYYADGDFDVVASYEGATATLKGTVGGTAAVGFTGTIIAGDGQSVPRTGLSIPGGQATFAPLQVKVVDSAGKAAAGVSVGFGVGIKPPVLAVQMTPMGGGGLRVTTDSNGVATLNQMGGNSMTCYYDEGPFTIVASIDGGNQVTFNETVAPTPAVVPEAGATLKLISGNSQSHPRMPTSHGIDIAYFDPMVVQLLDASGNPMAGEQVSWSSPSHPAGMAVQMEPSGASPCIVVTDSNGMATLNKMGGKSVQAYYADGNFTIAAVYGSASVTFEGTVGGAAERSVTASIVAGDGQSVPRTGLTVPGGQATFAPLQVKLVDKDGNPAAGVSVGFGVGSKPSGMAVQMSPMGGGGLSVSTGADGIATLNQMGGNSMTCYYAMGPFTIVASPTGGDPVTFSLTVSQ